MFKELLLDTLQSLSPEEKLNVRDILNEEKIEDRVNENKEEGEPIMSNEKDNAKVDTSINVDETTKKVGEETTKTEKVDETEKVEETTKDSQEPKKDGEDEKVEETTDDAEPTDPSQVQETEQTGNGVRLEDLVTKEELAERLSSLEAKFDAVLKENTDLKDKLSAMEDKYENKDFGNVQKQGMVSKDKDANNSFDEYSKQFM